MADKFTNEYLRAIKGTAGTSTAPAATSADDFTNKYLAEMGATNKTAQVQSPATPYKLRTVLDNTVKPVSVTTTKATAPKTDVPKSETAKQTTVAPKNATFWEKLGLYLSGSTDTTLPNVQANDSSELIAENALSGAVDSAKGAVNLLNYYGQGAMRGKLASAEAQQKADAAITGSKGSAALADNFKSTLDAQEAKGLTAAVDWGKGLKQDIAERSQTADKATLKIGEVANTVGGMVPSMVSNAVLPGSGLLVMGAGAAGNAIEQAKAEGASDAGALTYGTAVGAIEAATEKMFDGVFGVFGKGVADDAVEKLVTKYVKSGTAQNAILTLTSMLGEGAEEFVAEVTENWMNRLTAKTDDRRGLDLLSDAGKSAAMGALVSALFQGAQVMQRGDKITAAQIADNAVAAIDGGGAAQNTQNTATSPTAAQEVTQGDTAVTTQDGVETPQSATQAVAEGKPYNPFPEGTLGAKVVNKAENAKQGVETAENAVVETTPVEQKVPQNAEKTLEQHVDEFNSRNDEYTRRLEAAQANDNITDEEYTWLSNESESLSLEYQNLIRDIRVSKGEVSKNYNSAENHIDNRTMDGVAKRSIKAFQFDHPELHRYFVDAAKALGAEAGGAVDVDRYTTNYNRGSVKAARNALSKKYRGVIIDAISLGLSKPEIMKCCEDIIEDNGQENYAAAKRIEIILDKMLSDGYTTNQGENVSPNNQYISAKGTISGSETIAERRVRQARENYKLLDAIEGEPSPDELLAREKEYADIRSKYSADQESQNKGELPSGVGAMSNPFTPKQEVSKVFTNTYQKTDSINDTERAQMKPEDYTYDVIGHAQNESASQQRVDVDYEGEVADLYAKQDWTGEDVFTAKKILDKVAEKARETGDYSEFNKWTKAIQQRGTSGGQTIEAFKAFQKTPEGAVIKAQQVVDAAGQKLTTKKENGKDVDNAKGRKIKADSDNAKKAVKESADESARATDPADVAVEWWIRDTSKKLSDRIDGNVKSKSAKTYTTMQTILNDLVRITKNAAPQGETVKAKATVATNTLRNYWANSEQYQGAVERAQRYINEKYADNPESLAVFNDWLSGGGINTWELLGKSLQENGVKFSDILMSSWQDKAMLLDNVTKAIMADTDLTDSEAQQAAQAISDKFYDELATRAQKKIEQLLKPSTPEQQKTMYQKINEFINSGVFDDSAIVDLVRAKYGIPTLTAADVQKIYELNKLAQEATNDYQKRVFLNRAAMVIADKMPVTKKNKVLAVRRIAMLLNPKTLISRNAGGNVIFGLLEDIKDAPGTLIDLGVSKLTGQRTTSYNPFATSKAEFLGAKKGLVEWGKDIKNGVDTSQTEHEMPRSSALKSKIGSATEEALNKLLQLGDRPFFEAAKAKRLDEMKRLGLDYTSEDAIADATAYALERVFQNNSALAKSAMKLRESLGVLGDIAIPFAQTPSNILDKLIDYSPYGYVRAIKKAGTVGDSAWSQKQFVDTLARSMTGTGLIAFGFAAAMNGLLTGGGDDGKDEGETYQNKVSGWQPYSVFVDGKSYTYDWATVGGVLLGFGADMANMADGKADVLSILMNGTTMGINTLFNQSYLTGVSDLFGGDDIGKGIENMLIGLPSSFTPTALQQIARIVDPVSRDTYDKNGFVRAWNKVKAKLPGLSMTLPAKIGVDGKEMTNFQGGTLSNIFESVLSPGYINKQRSTAIDTEVQRLYANTKVTAALPNWSEYTSKSDLTFTTNKVEYEMSSAEWETYQKTRGKYTYKALDTLFKSAAYKAMSDEEKVKAVSGIYADATAEAKRKIIEGRGEMYLPDSTAVKLVDSFAGAGLSKDKAYSLYKTLDALEPESGKTQVSTYQKISTIYRQGYTDKQTSALVASYYTSKNDDGVTTKESILPELNIAKRLVSLYMSSEGESSDLVNMAVPRTFSENSVTYELTDAEMELFKSTFARYFNQNSNNVMSAETLSRLRDDAYNRAKYAVLRGRK